MTCNVSNLVLQGLHAVRELKFLFVFWQIFRQELENRRSAIQHQQQQYGEGQEEDESNTAPLKRQRIEADGDAVTTTADVEEQSRHRRSPEQED